MNLWPASCISLLLGVLVGCHGALPPIFPPADPPLVWPPPPDTPRIRYIGALYGQSSLGTSPQGWAAVRAFLAGPAHPVDFVRPSAVAVAGERVFVADIGLAVVHLLDLDARTYRALTGAPSDPLRVPIDVAVVPPNRLLVLDRVRAAIDTFDLDGTWRETRRWPEVVGPVSLAFDEASGVLWIADAPAHTCWAIGPNGVPTPLGHRGTGLREFNYPSAVALSPRAGLAVVDAMNFRVQIFEDVSSAPTAFGTKGDAAGNFARPRDVAIDSAGHIYVLDNQFENVQVFSTSGELLMAFGQGGHGPGEFSLPSGITIDEHDRIWIADSFNRRVQVFQYLAEAGP